MEISKVLEGLKANYAPGLHPTEVAERDFVRTLRNMGFQTDQLDRLYDELLSSCDFFPKVFDVHQAVLKLGLTRPERNQLNKTKELLDDYSRKDRGGMTFREWFHNGGYEFICRDCGHDQVKIRRRLQVMGIPLHAVDAPKPKNNKSEPTLLGEVAPEFPCADPSTDVVVEYQEPDNPFENL